MKKEIKRPNNFSIDPQPMKGEVFKKIPMVQNYEVSNFGRVISIKGEKRTILLPYRVKKGNEFCCVLKLGDKKKRPRISDLMYRAHVAQPQAHEKAVCADGNVFNLTLDNLDLVLKYAERSKHNRRKKPVEKEPLRVFLKELVIDINVGNQSGKLLELYKLKKHYYVASSDNGRYLLKLKKA